MLGVRLLRVASTPRLRCKARTRLPVASPQPPRQSHRVDTRLHCALRCSAANRSAGHPLRARGSCKSQCAMTWEAKAGREVGRVAGTRIVYREEPGVV
jgi:hypothetical protein